MDTLKLSIDYCSVSRAKHMHLGIWSWHPQVSTYLMLVYSTLLPVCICTTHSTQEQYWSIPADTTSTQLELQQSTDCHDNSSRGYDTWYNYITYRGTQWHEKGPYPAMKSSLPGHFLLIRLCNHHTMMLKSFNICNGLNILSYKCSFLLQRCNSHTH